MNGTRVPASSGGIGRDAQLVFGYCCFLKCGSLQFEEGCAGYL